MLLLLLLMLLLLLLEACHHLLHAALAMTHAHPPACLHGSGGVHDALLGASPLAPSPAYLVLHAHFSFRSNSSSSGSS
jgi:hypothetical protein